MVKFIKEDKYFKMLEFFSLKFYFTDFYYKVTILLNVPFKTEIQCSVEKNRLGPECWCKW